MPRKRWGVLARLIRDHDLRIGAEIGVKSGRNIAETLRSCPWFYWIAVDPWERNENYARWRPEQFRRHEREFDEIARQWPANVRKVKAYSVDAAPHIEDGSLDLVFIDGDHSYEGARADIVAWRPKVRPGGWLTGHDYHHPRFPEVTEAVDGLLSGVTEASDRVWLRQV